jgi:hypothetical protein
MDKDIVDSPDLCMGLMHGNNGNRLASSLTISAIPQTSYFKAVLSVGGLHAW